MSAYHFKYFQNIQFKNHGIAPTPPDLPTLKAYPTPGVGGRFEIFSLKWRERMNLKVPGAILPLGCAILSTRAITVRGGWYNPPLGELGLNSPNLQMGWDTHGFKSLPGFFCVLLRMTVHVSMVYDQTIYGRRNREQIWGSYFVIEMIKLSYLDLIDSRPTSMRHGHVCVTKY